MNSLLNIQGGPPTDSVEAVAALIDTIFSGAHAARLSDETVQEALKVIGNIFQGNTNVQNCNFYGGDNS